MIKLYIIHKTNVSLVMVTDVEATIVVAFFNNFTFSCKIYYTIMPYDIIMLGFHEHIINDVKNRQLLIFQQIRDVL